jgi:protein-tyrosine kinase
MSEIFSYLRKAEAERRKLPKETPSTPLIAVPAAGPDNVNSAHAIVGEQREPAPVVAEPAPEPSSVPVVATQASYDLSLADPRVRSVLDPATLIGEQFRMLRARLAQLQKQSGIKILLVTSATPAEGKTFISCSLAGVLSQEPGKRVVLVDADLRKPKVGKNLGMRGDEAVQGLGDILRDGVPVQNCLAGKPNGTLFLLPAGTVPQNPVELLSTPRFEATLKILRDTFDWVIIDSPPVISLADSSVIAPLTDSILMIVHANRTPAKLTKEAIERVGREKICGVVLNRARQLKTSKYYYSYYKSK